MTVEFDKRREGVGVIVSTTVDGQNGLLEIGEELSDKRSIVQLNKISCGEYAVFLVPMFALTKENVDEMSKHVTTYGMFGEGKSLLVEGTNED